MCMSYLIMVDILYLVRFVENQFKFVSRYIDIHIEFRYFIHFSKRIICLQNIFGKHNYVKIDNLIIYREIWMHQIIITILIVH